MIYEPFAFSWNPYLPYESLQEAAKVCYADASVAFLADETFPRLLLFFHESDGLIAQDNVPREVPDKQLVTQVRNAIREYDVYGIIQVAEASAYLSKARNDHTIVQLVHNEMQVSDLHDEDKRKYLICKVQCVNGDGFVFLKEIVRFGVFVSLGDLILIDLKNDLTQDRFFGSRP